MASSSIDWHKLMLHPDRVGPWLLAGDGWERLKKIYPIYIEVSPTNFCPHNCIFCGLDFFRCKKGDRPLFIDKDIFRERVREMGRLGIKSIMFGGEGEPSCHKDIAEIACETKKAGIDVSFTCIWVSFSEETLDKIIPVATWMKASIDAGTKEIYVKVHRAPAEHFEKVVKNLNFAAEKKTRENYRVELAIQMVLLRENFEEVEEIILLGKKIGVNRVIIKPYSQHPLGINQYPPMDYDQCRSYLEEISKKYSSNKFSVIARIGTMGRMSVEKPYQRCLSVPFFWAYLASNWDVYACSNFLGDKRFLVGNIKDQSFQEVWEGEGRRRCFEFVSRELEAGTCRRGCRMDSDNRYLWRLKHPETDDNFI